MLSQTEPKVTEGNRRELTKTQARLEKQVTRSESDIAGLETRIKSRDQELADPELYQDFARWHELQKEQDQWKKELERMTARWESLSGELEEIRQKLTVRN